MPADTRDAAIGAGLETHARDRRSNAIICHGRVIHLREKIEIAAAREERVKAGSVEGGADARRRAHRTLRQIAIEEPNVTFVAPYQSKQYAKQRRLARAIGTKQSVDLAAYGGYPDVTQGTHFPEPLRHTAGGDDRGSRIAHGRVTTLPRASERSTWRRR